MLSFIFTYHSGAPWQRTNQILLFKTTSLLGQELLSIYCQHKNILSYYLSCCAEMTFLGGICDHDGFVRHVCLRGCIDNFRTSKKDIEEIIEIIVREGKKMHRKLQEK